MQHSASPPTERVLAIVELLANHRGDGLRLVDLARRLSLSQSTALAIVATLCARGWASRDPVNKTFSLGPALELIAARADLVRPLAHATRAAAIELAQELGYTVSVTERTGDHLTLNFLGGDPGNIGSSPAGQRIPFSAPFGPAFAAWETAADRLSWIARGSLTQPELVERLEDYLNTTRQRGFSVEYMAPTFARTAHLFEPLGDDPWSSSMRHVIQEAMLEIAAAGFVPDRVDAKAEVTAIGAPVLDRHGRALLNIGMHPFAPLAIKQVNAIGERLLQVTTALGADEGQAGASLKPPT